MPFDDRPISVRSGKRGTAQTADERVTRARGQAKPPRGHIPNKSGQHRAEHGPHGDDFRIDQTFADRGSNRAAEQRTGQIKECGHRNCLPRREDFGRDDGCDGVGRVVKTVAVFKNYRREDDDEEKQHVDLARWARRLSILQNNLQDDVAGVATAIDYFFEQLVEIAQKNNVLR